MKNLFIRLLRIKYIFNFFKFLNKKNSHSKLVLFIPKINLLYFFRTNFLWDLATLNLLNQREVQYDVLIGLSSLKKIRNRKVLYNPGYNLNEWGVDNDVALFPLISNILENQSNEVMPSSYEISYWENKAFMYDSFIQNKINMPDTYVITKENFEFICGKLDKNSRWLFKPNHSKSSIGIVEIKKNLNSFIKNKLETNKYVVIQKIINIDRDCRMIVINGKIVLQYWRNKINSTEWVPTSTSTGSKVLFMDYPQSLEKWAILSTKRLGLKSAAWDIVFDETDDSMSNPMALEVSPIYYPNPRENYDPSKSYNSYKGNINYENYLLNEFETHIKEKLSPWVGY